MPDKVELKEKDGFQITVTTYSGIFYAAKGDVRLQADTLEKLEQLIKETNREQRRFKPIDVIHVSNDVAGRITSRVAGDETSVYFSHKESEGAKATRTQESLESGHWGSRDNKYRFVKATPKNLAILEQVKGKQQQIDALHNEMEALRKTYGDCVTQELVDAQAEAKKQ